MQNQRGIATEFVELKMVLVRIKIFVCSKKEFVNVPSNGGTYFYGRG